MLLRFNQQVRIAEEGIHIRHFEKGAEYEVTDKLGERILELWPESAVRVKREDPALTTKKLVIKPGGKPTEDDEE